MIIDYDNNKIEYFELENKNYDNNKIEYFELENKKWLKGSDLGNVLKLSNYRMGIKSHCDNSMICKKNYQTYFIFER